MPENVIKIGIMPREDYKQRTIAIAKGAYTPKGNEPKVWFESLQSMARYGIVELKKNNRRIVPRVKASDFQVEFGIKRQQIH